MKYLLIIACLFCAACKGGSYQMKITYVANKAEGGKNTTRNQHISAVNDSLAYVRATLLFNQMIEENHSAKTQADHFELYNPKGVLVKNTNP